MKDVQIFKEVMVPPKQEKEKVKWPKLPAKINFGKPNSIGWWAWKMW